MKFMTIRTRLLANRQEECGVLRNNFVTSYRRGVAPYRENYDTSSFELLLLEPFFFELSY